MSEVEDAVELVEVDLGVLDEAVALHQLGVDLGADLGDRGRLVEGAHEVPDVLDRAAADRHPAPDVAPEAVDERGRLVDVGARGGHVDLGGVEVLGLDRVLGHAQLVAGGVGLGLHVHHRPGQQAQSDQDEREHAKAQQHPGPAASPGPGARLVARHLGPRPRCVRRRKDKGRPVMRTAKPPRLVRRGGR